MTGTGQIAFACNFRFLLHTVLMREFCLAAQLSIFLVHFDVLNKRPWAYAASGMYPVQNVRYVAGLYPKNIPLPPPGLLRK
jgi:hypothetical protein